MGPRKHRQTNGIHKNHGEKAGRSKRHSVHKNERSGKDPTPHPPHVGGDIYCAIARPHFGNYYHWALALHDTANDKWETFHVVQATEDGPFERKKMEEDPRKAMDCVFFLRLGQIAARRCACLSRSITGIPVPGEGALWNGQDYVMDIWEMARDSRMVNEETWYEGKRAVLPYYGPDYGGQMNDSGSQDEEREKEEEHGDASGNKTFPLSEEYVYDSEFSGTGTLSSEPTEP
ncbi:hypothetical protein F5Y17DRAFT_38026 [Xylariaceae sp. FL0594]|nr:hypothetical protein F5Y17DRAFT_38026 [Xylariaceae sp. FL0594]